MSVMKLNFDYTGITASNPGNILHLEGIDNDKINEEVLSNKNNRLDVNPLQSHYEDTYVPNSESVDHLLFKIDSVNLKSAISGLPYGPYTVKNLNIVICKLCIEE